MKTEKTAEGEADSPASYQYYDEEQGGKRASGWYQIEGIEGISEEGEEYYFYFKNGKPYYSQEAGLELFNINSERYASMKKAKCRLVSRLWLSREAVRPSTTLETMEP